MGFFRWAGPQGADPPPTLSSLLAESVDPALAEGAQTFRRAHLLQTAAYFAASSVILAAFLFAFLSAGWNLLSLLLAVAELLLLFTHGTPVLIDVTRVLSISAEGIESRDIFGRRSISWWEVQGVLSADDLSRFRAEGIRSRLTVNTSAHSPETRTAIYRALRSHLSRYQRDLQPWPQGAPLIRFAKANGLGVGLFAAVMILTVVVGQRVLPQGNVLGLRCAYASDYLREKYDLPDRHGCVILRVNPGTGAHKAGLREGDMIVEVEGVPISSGPQFTVYWESLDKRKQEFVVVRPGDTGEVTFKVTLGGHGRLPEYDPEDPYFFYLRARGSDDTTQAYEDFSRAIELAPDFDLAYVYRAALLADDLAAESALPDLSRALELDPRLSEAYRWRGRAYSIIGGYDLGLADTSTAILLDGCADGFRGHNYDCHHNYLIVTDLYGFRGGSGNFEQAVQAAKTAIEFYPDRPGAYYITAYYLDLLKREEEARQFADLYLAHAEGHDEPSERLNWARALVSGAPKPEQGQISEGETQRVFVDEGPEKDRLAEGPPIVTAVMFAEERTDGRPETVGHLSPDAEEVWAYFEFDNAANVNKIDFEWSQNQILRDIGTRVWPDVNKGSGWIRLPNIMLGERNRGTLALKFDDQTSYSSSIAFRNEAFIGALSFFHDPAGTQPLLLYTGDQSTIYASFEYTAIPHQSGLVWSAEQNGLQLGTDSISAEGSGRAAIVMPLGASINQGLLDVRIFLDGQFMRSAVLAVAPTSVKSSPPFQTFATGLDIHGEGELTPVTKDIPVSVPEFYYLLDGISLSATSVLTLRWTIDGQPLWNSPETIAGTDGSTGYWGLQAGTSSDDGYLDAGEYRLVISLDGQAVYADVVVVQ